MYLRTISHFQIHSTSIEYILIVIFGFHTDISFCSSIKKIGPVSENIHIELWRLLLEASGSQLHSFYLLSINMEGKMLNVPEACFFLSGSFFM